MKIRRPKLDWTPVDGEGRKALDLTRLQKLMGKYARFRHKPVDEWSRFVCNEYVIHATQLADGRVITFTYLGEEKLPKDMLNGDIHTRRGHASAERRIYENENAFIDDMRDWREDLSEFDRYCSGY